MNAYVDAILRAIRTPAARIVMAILLLASVPLYVLSYTLIPKTGDWGFTSTGWTGTVVAVQQHGSAWNAGMRKGDVVVIPASERVKSSIPLAGDRMQLTIRRGKVSRTIEVTAAPARIDFTAAAAIRTAVNFCLLVFSLLIIFRAWNTEFGPLIAATLTSSIFQAAVDQMPWFANSGWQAVLMGANEVALEVSFAAYPFFLVLLCAAVAGRTTRTLRFLFWATVANVLISCTAGLAYQLPIFYVWLPDAVSKFLTTYLYVFVFITVPALLAALGAARGEYRPRTLWLFWGLFPNCLGVALHAVGDLWFVPQTAFTDPLVQTIGRGLEISLPLALFYGLLVRRTIDLGFVVNRVAVYGLISAAVLGIFVLLEYLAGQFIETHGAASWAIQLGIAMTIGVSARFLHGAVDRFVDRVFFAKRHADETALKRFAQEAEAFTSAEALLDRALDAVNTHSDTIGAAIYLCGESEAQLVRGTGFPQLIDIDDPLLVALRRWSEPIDTHDAKTAFPDGMVFPMSARGKLVGALACQTKRDTTAFAPDEREPLAEVARSLARALEVLGTRTDGTTETIVPLLLSLQTAVATVQQSVANIQLHLAAGETELTA